MKAAKNKEFYLKVTQRNKEFISNHEDWLSTYKGEINNNIRISNLAYFIWHLNNIIASYSKGDTKGVLKKQYSETIIIMEKVWDKKITKVYHGKKQEELNQYKFNHYLYILQMFSLGILLDVPDKEFNILVHLIDRDEIKDFLIEFMISHRIKNREPILEESYKRYLLIPKLYGKLVEIIKNKDNLDNEKKVKVFLDKEWIKIPKNHFINFKLKDIPNYEVSSGFVGLWAFEVAAIVKIKQLNDSSFKDNVFYPENLFNN